MILPDGQRIRYNCIEGADCSNYVPARLEHTATQTEFYKSIISWNGVGWDLTMKDGTVYMFADNGKPTAIRDKLGNQLMISRGTGRLPARIVSARPMGAGWILPTVGPKSPR